VPILQPEGQLQKQRNNKKKTDNEQDTNKTDAKERKKQTKVYVSNKLKTDYINENNAT
jgi:hypothetical protein